jgi:hypothetical protein
LTAFLLIHGGNTTGLVPAVTMPDILAGEIASGG